MKTTLGKMGFFGMLLLLLLGCREEKHQQDIGSDTEQKTQEAKVVRYASVIKVKPEMLEKYKELHANPWPGVTRQIAESNIRNYSIYLKDDYLFGYFEYTGDDFEADMAKMAQDSTTQAWWKVTDPCQIPLPTRKDGEWWASMEEVFHQD